METVKLRKEEGAEGSNGNIAGPGARSKAEPDAWKGNRRGLGREEHAGAAEGEHLRRETPSAEHAAPIDMPPSTRHSGKDAAVTAGGDNTWSGSPRRRRRLRRNRLSHVAHDRALESGHGDEGGEALMPVGSSVSGSQQDPETQPRTDVDVVREGVEDSAVAAATATVDGHDAESDAAREDEDQKGKGVGIVSASTGDGGQEAEEALSSGNVLEVETESTSDENAAESHGPPSSMVASSASTEKRDVEVVDLSISAMDPPQNLEVEAELSRGTDVEGTVGREPSEINIHGATDHQSSADVGHPNSEAAALAPTSVGVTEGDQMLGQPVASTPEPGEGVEAEKRVGQAENGSASGTLDRASASTGADVDVVNVDSEVEETAEHSNRTVVPAPDSGELRAATEAAAKHGSDEGLLATGTHEEGSMKEQGAGDKAVDSVSPSGMPNGDFATQEEAPEALDNGAVGAEVAEAEGATEGGGERIRGEGSELASSGAQQPQLENSTAVAVPMPKQDVQSSTATSNVTEGHETKEEPWSADVKISSGAPDGGSASEAKDAGEVSDPAISGGESSAEQQGSTALTAEGNASVVEGEGSSVVHSAVQGSTALMTPEAVTPAPSSEIPEPVLHTEDEPVLEQSDTGLAAEAGEEASGSNAAPSTPIVTSPPVVGAQKDEAGGPGDADEGWSWAGTANAGASGEGAPGGGATNSAVAGLPSRGNATMALVNTTSLPEVEVLHEEPGVPHGGIGGDGPPTYRLSNHTGATGQPLKSSAEVIREEAAGTREEESNESIADPPGGLVEKASADHVSTTEEATLPPDDRQGGAGDTLHLMGQDLGGGDEERGSMSRGWDWEDEHTAEGSESAAAAAAAAAKTTVDLAAVPEDGVDESARVGEKEQSEGGGEGEYGSLGGKGEAVSRVPSTASSSSRQKRFGNGAGEQGEGDVTGVAVRSSVAGSRSSADGEDNEREQTQQQQNELHDGSMNVTDGKASPDKTPDAANIESSRGGVSSGGAKGSSSQDGRTFTTATQASRQQEEDGEDGEETRHEDFIAQEEGQGESGREEGENVSEEGGGAWGQGEEEGGGDGKEDERGDSGSNGDGEGCGEIVACEECRETPGCTWEADDVGRCVVAQGSIQGGAEASCPADGGSGIPEIEAGGAYEEATPPALWMTAGVPVLVVLICGGLLVCAAKVVRKFMAGGGRAGADYAAVNTANPDDAVEGGDNWEWDGEDEDGQDIEMAPISTSSAGVAAASRSSASAPPTEPLTFQASRASSGSGESTALASGGALGQKHGLMLGESGGPPEAGESAEDGRRRGGGRGRGGRGRGGRGGSGRGPKPSSSRGKREESASNILPDDDLFAELGIEAKPVFRGNKPPPPSSASARLKGAPASLALGDAGDSGSAAAWVDDDLDDLLK